MGKRLLPLLLVVFAGCTEPNTSSVYDLTGTFLYSKETRVGCCPSVSADSIEISSPVAGVLRLTRIHGFIVDARLEGIVCNVCNGETTALMVSAIPTVPDSIELVIAGDPGLGNPRFRLAGSSSPDGFTGRIIWEYFSSGSLVRGGTLAARRR